jgi:hypothetical protein
VFPATRAQRCWVHKVSVYRLSSPVLASVA